MATACRATFPLLPPYTSHPKPANTSNQLHLTTGDVYDARAEVMALRIKNLRLGKAARACGCGSLLAGGIDEYGELDTPGELVAKLAQAAAAATANAAASTAAAAAAALKHGAGFPWHLEGAVLAAAADAAKAAADAASTAAGALQMHTARIVLPPDEVFDIQADLFGACEESEDYDTYLLTYCKCWLT